VWRTSVNPETVCLGKRCVGALYAYSTQREQPFHGKVNRDSTAK
jgi:hypothetical protein